MRYLKNPISKPNPLWFDMDVNGQTRRLRSFSEDALYAMCRTHGLALPLAEFRCLLYHRMCLELDPDYCMGEMDGDKPIKRLTWPMMKGFVAAVVATTTTKILGEDTHVSQAEADRRASVCKGCRHNAIVDCAGCQGIHMLAHPFTAGRELREQSFLGGCTVCGCWLRAKIWASAALLRRIGDDAHEYPDKCWCKEVFDG